MKRRTDIGFIITKIVAYAFSILLTLVCFFPVVTLLVSSTHTTNEILRGMSIIPGTSFFENLSRISFTDLGINIWGAMGNSLIIAVSSSILSVYISAMTAYAIKAYRARGSRLFYGMILMVIMIPAQVSIIGFYKYVSMLGLLNNYLPLILPAAAAPTTVFFIKQYLDSVMQISLIEAARIDGAGEFMIFNRIILPIMAPAIATMGLMAFITSWNNFITPYVLINRMELYTIPLTTVLLNFNNVTPDYGARYAALVVSLLPILIVYLFTGKYVIRGISIGGVKE